MVIIHIVMLVYQRVTMGIHCFGIPLRDSPQFPSVSGLPLAVAPGTAAKDPPRRAVVFVVGGCTYEEVVLLVQLRP